MKIYRGTKNLSPLLLLDFYPANGQFGKGMYFGQDDNQPKCLSTAFLEAGFAIVGSFELNLEDYTICTHTETSAQSDTIFNCEVEVTQFEVIIKKSTVKFKLVSFEIGFKDRYLAQKLMKYANQGTLDEQLEVFWVSGLDPTCASLVHNFLVQEELKVIG